MKFEEIIQHVLDEEGGYVNDPSDRGGETKYGISKRSYPNIDIKELIPSDAVNIYYNDYWVPSKAGELEPTIRHTYFDMVVNMGQGNAVKVLQQAINSKKRDKIAVDGIIGSQTIGNANKVSKKRLQAYRCLYYSNIVARDPSQERFYYGWWKRAQKV